MNKSIKLHVYAALAAGLALSPIAAHAQTSPAANSREGITTSADAGRDERGNRNHYRDYGWLGLVGLLGLAGLIRKNRHDRYDTTSIDRRRSDLAGTRS